MIFLLQTFYYLMINIDICCICKKKNKQKKDTKSLYFQNVKFRLVKMQIKLVKIQKDISKPSTVQVEREKI